MISHEKVHKTQNERGYITCQVCGLQLMADVPNSLKNHMTKHTGTLDHNNMRVIRFSVEQKWAEYAICNNYLSKQFLEHWITELQAIIDC